MKNLTLDLIKFEKIVKSCKTTQHIKVADNYRKNLYTKYKPTLDMCSGMDLHFQMLLMIKNQKKKIKSSTFKYY